VYRIRQIIAEKEVVPERAIETYVIECTSLTQERDQDVMVGSGVTPSEGIVNLMSEKKSFSERMDERKARGGRLSRLLRCYAAVCIPVTSFHPWNRLCMRA